MHMRSELRKEEWDAPKRNRDAMGSERDKTRTKTAGASFFQRLRIPKEERGEWRTSAARWQSEIESLCQKERLRRRDPDPGVPPEKNDNKK